MMCILVSAPNVIIKRFSRMIDNGKRQLDRYLEAEDKFSGKNMIFLERKLGFPYLLIDWNLKNKTVDIPYDEYLLELNMLIEK